MPTISRDLPESVYPFTVEVVNDKTGEVVYTERIEEPGILRIPGRIELGDAPMGIRITGHDGTEHYEPPTEGTQP